MKKESIKRFFSLCIVVAMVLSMCPTIVFAEDTTDYSGYTYVAFGDSITYGIDGDYSSGEAGYRMEKPYPTLVAETLGIGTVVNQAKSGATWTQHSTRTNMTERIMRYNGDADIISVMLGVNDYAAKCALGDMNSRDNTTIYGSIHMAANHLTTKYPDAFIFFMTPFKYRTENNGKYTLSDVANAVKEVAAVYDIPVLDMYTNGQFDPATGAKDQIHPTQAHHINYTAPMICEFIKQYNAPASKDACPCDTCKGADATWENWDGTAAFANGKHYRVSKDVQLTGVISIPKGTTVVLDLNGKTITAAANSRCFAISGELVIVNSTADKDADGNYTGLITGGSASVKDVNGDQRGGNIVIENGTSASAPGGTLKLYGGTIANGTAPNAGGNLKVGKYTKFYMYGGAIVDGRSESTSSGVGNGGNMNVDAGSNFEMRGGEISGGVASFSGGNIYNYRGTITLYDGIITGGKANATSSNRGGGNIWLNSTNAKLILKGGLISDGESKRFGGNILVDNASGKITVEGGAITGGKAAVSGGSIYIAKGQLEMTGGVLSGGKANWDFANNNQSTGTNDGGNLYLTDSGAKAYLGGNAVVTGGNAGTGGYGGNVYMTSSAELYLYGNAQVTSGEGYGGKNIYAMTTPKVVMYGGTVKNGTFNTYTSGSFHMYGGQIEDLRWASDSGTQETVIYNGIVGSNISGLPEKLDVWAADCATVTQTTHLEGHKIYAIYQTNLANGACATCGHTYSAAKCGTCKYAHPAIKVENCEFCNEDAVWAPLLGNEPVADHYYLPADVALTDKIGLAVGDGLCIDLNGHNLITADVSSGITMTSAKLNITNTGADASAIISGGGGILAANMASGQSRSAVNFKNVMITGGHSSENGGNISTNGVNLVLDNCAISGGYAPKNGGNVCCYATNLTIKGNTRITGGFAGNNGDDLYLGTTSKVQMYSGAVGDVCQLNSTGSFHLYDGALDSIRVYNYTNSTSSYNASFFMYGGSLGAISFPGTSSATGSGKVVVYAGTTGFDPRTANRESATMIAACSCVTQNADGTYTTIHTEGSAICDICAANDVYEGGYTYPETLVGAHTYPESWTEGKKECENCGSILGCEHTNTTLTGYQDASCLAPGYSGDYVCDDCGTTTETGSDLEQKAHEYGDDNYCDNGCGKIKCAYNDCVPGTPVKEKEVAPSCGEAGSYELVTYCDICGEELHRVPKVDPATGAHNYNQENPDAQYKATNATCNAAATYFYSCSCGAKGELTFSYGEADKNVHANLKQEKAQAPTCTEDGWKAYEHCDACGYSTYEVDPQTGHSYTSTYTPATETADAYTTYRCACGDSYVEVEEGTMLHVVVNEQTGESYADVKSALTAAAKGETVKLLRDTTTQNLYIGVGKSLDLNGYKLTVSGYISASYTTTHITDNTNGEGLLIVADADVALNEKNKQLPLWTAEGVRFVTVTFGQALDFKDATGAANENVGYYRFAFEEKAAQTVLDDVLANGSDGTGVIIRIKVNYTLFNGMKAAQYFEFTSEMVKQYVNDSNGWDGNMFTLYLTGVAGLKDLSFTAEILSVASDGAVVVIGSTPVSK